ncbi:ATP-binding protein [Cohnella boryungensis]|uniref:histidine kinase n=2 Tax=Cohnella boryungensis TaxID=768479 RepID=A0ABV8S9F4_9BACL
MMIWIFLLVVLPGISVTAYFYITITGALKESAYEKELQTNYVAQRSIESLGETILGVTITNGYWEANRQALLSRDMEWLERNIGDMPRVVPNIDFVAEADLEGRILVQAGDVEQFQNRIEVPHLLERFGEEKTFSGLLDTSKGLAVVAVSQVTGDTGENGTAGLLVTGHYLNERDMARVQDTLQAQLALELASGQFLSSTDMLTLEVLREIYGKLPVGEPAELVKHDRLSVTQSAVPFKDMTGRTIGRLYTQSQSGSSMETVSALNKLALYSAFGLAFLLVLVAYLLRNRIVRPLRHLTAMLEQVAAGKQVDDIPKYVEQSDKELLQAFGRIGSLNEQLKLTVETRTAALQNLLNYSQQGFFTVHSDLRVGDEYSLPCVRFFGREIAGASFPELIYPDNEREAKLLADIAAEVFVQEDELQREMVVSLLPEELNLQELVISAEYKIISGTDGSSTELMVILTDITERRMIEEQIARERANQQMVVQVVTHLEETNQILTEYRRFCEMGIVDALRSPLPLEQRLLSVYKRIHTFKGSFSMLQFPLIVPRLHALETELQARIRLIGLSPDYESVEESLREFRIMELHTWVDEDLKALTDILGEEMLYQRNQESTLSIPRGAWRRLENKLAEALAPTGHRELLSELRELRNTPFRGLVEHYRDYLETAAERQGIPLNPVVLEGEDVTVDPQRFRPFAQSLIHVFRNIVVHAIEPSEERLLQNKEACGTVALRFGRQGDRLIVVISDDGRGIRSESLRERLVEKGIIAESAARLLTSEELIAYIFRDEMTTAESVSELSGRGVGLSAVQEETEKLGGSVEVASVPGEGTTFTFSLPLEANESIEEDVPGGTR